MAGFRGPTEIGWAVFPGRGISYSGTYEDRNVQISFSEKRTKIRIFVDGTEFVAKPTARVVVIDGVKYEPVAPTG